MRGEAAQGAGACLRRKLVDGLDRSGHGRTAIRSEALRQAFLEVPRELFVPELADAEGLEARPLGRLGGPGRRRLLSIALQDPEVTPLGLRAPVYVVLVFMSLALPDAVLVESRRSDGAGIGIVDRDGAGLTLLAGTHRHIIRIQRYGKAPAPKPLRDALEEWVALGRPGLADLRINVSYRRRPRSRGVWRAVRRGPSVMCFDWARRAP